MKFRASVLFLFALLALSQVSTKRVNSKKANTRVLTSTKYDFENPVGNFIFKALTAMVGLDDEKLVACITGILSGTLGDPRTPEEIKKADEERKENFSVLGTALNVATTLISFVCSWKEKLVTFVADLFADARRLRRNRLFFQGKSLSFKWCLTCWLKEKYKKVVDTVIETGHKVYEVASKKLKTFGDALKNGLDKVLHFISWTITSLTSLYDKYVRPILRKFKTAGACVSVAASVALAVTALVENLPALGTPAGIAIIIKNIICAVEDIVAAIKAFYEGWNEPKNNIKWGKFGTAFGTITRVVTGIKAGRRFRFMEKKHK